MIFWASSETYQPAGDNLNVVWKCVEPYLNAQLQDSTLATLDCKLRYVPIIMPPGMRERYPARSRLRKKENVYLCAPQLDYDVFVEGTFEDQLREYLKGIEPSAPHLAKLGATAEQIADFERIMATAAERIIAERPDQTRH